MAKIIRLLGWVFGGVSLLLNQASASVPVMDRVVWIWLEGVTHAEVSSGSFIRNLIRNQPSIRFSGFSGVGKSTQGDALAMIAGTDLGIKDNELTRIFTPTLIDLLESKGTPWKVYAEDFPGACYLSQGNGNYKRYRVPFLSLDQVQSNRYLCMNILNFSNYLDDLRNGTLGQVSVFVPNSKNGGASGDLQSVDASLKSILSPILMNEDLMDRTTFVISTMWPSPTREGAPFAMIFGKKVNGFARVSSEPADHYSILRTLEEGLGLGSLNQADARAEALDGFWVNP